MSKRPGDIRAEQAGTVRVVVLVGEHDVSTLGRLKCALAVVTDGRVVVDLADCSFIDSSSLAVLFHACQARPPHRFAIVAPSQSKAEHLLGLVAFGAVVPVYATCEEAIAAVAAD